MVSVAGIEPTLQRPKRRVIPFHHTENLPYRSTLKCRHGRSLHSETFASADTMLRLPLCLISRILLYGKGTENRTRVGGLKVRYFTTKLCPQNLAGDQGFEPWSAGIKIRCLGPTWRIPNMWWTVRESNSQSRLAKPMLSHLTNPPVIFSILLLVFHYLCFLQQKCRFDYGN